MSETRRPICQSGQYTVFRDSDNTFSIYQTWFGDQILCACGVDINFVRGYLSCRKKEEDEEKRKDEAARLFLMDQGISPQEHSFCNDVTSIRRKFTL